MTTSDERGHDPRPVNETEGQNTAPADIGLDEEETGDAPRIVLVSELLKTIASELRPGFYNRVKKAVIEQKLLGIIHQGGHIHVPMHTNGKPDVPRRVREILLKNNEHLPDILLQIHEEADREVQLRAGARLKIDELLKIANTDDDFLAIAERAQKRTAMDLMTRAQRAKKKAKKPTRK